MHELVARLEAQTAGEVPIDPQLAIASAVANVICVLVFNERLADRPEFAPIDNMINQELKMMEIRIPAVLLQRFFLTFSVCAVLD